MKTLTILLITLTMAWGASDSAFAKGKSKKKTSVHKTTKKKVNKKASKKVQKKSNKKNTNKRVQKKSNSRTNKKVQKKVNTKTNQKKTNTKVNKKVQKNIKISRTVKVNRRVTVKNKKVANQLKRKNRKIRRLQHRNNWWKQHRPSYTRVSVSVIRNDQRWRVRYDRFAVSVVVRPRPISISIQWPVGFLPSPLNWHFSDYTQVENVSDKLVYLARQVYQGTYIGSSTGDQYLREKLLQLAFAAENFEDSVEESYDFEDSLYDLFYLEEALDNAEEALLRQHASHTVAKEMSALRYYIEELLYLYQNNI